MAQLIQDEMQCQVSLLKKMNISFTFCINWQILITEVGFSIVKIYGTNAKLFFLGSLKNKESVSSKDCCKLRTIEPGKS